MSDEFTEKVSWGNNRKLRTAAIVLITGICGWFMMELEILGVRLLTPFFGSAVEVVAGSVIGVFLLSLSVGYILGGWFSKKTNSKKILGVIVAAAGVWLWVMPFFIEPVCEAMYDAGLDEKWGSLFACLILFGVPTMLLGTVSPIAVHWLTSRASDSGLNAGVVLAFSTAAGFAGCLITTFYLVLVSMRLTMIISGIVLAALGGVILLQASIEGRRNNKTEEPSNE